MRWLGFYRNAAKIAGTVALWVFLGTAAHADAIDGDWCNKSGEHLSIDGPRIVTPGGKSMSGDYDRHAFSYAAPAGEKHAPNRLHMQLLSDDVMQMRLPDGASKQWQRCEIVS